MRNLPFRLFEAHMYVKFDFESNLIKNVRQVCRFLLTCQTGGASNGESQHHTLTHQCPYFKLAQCWKLIITGFLNISPLGPHNTTGLNWVCFSDSFGRCLSSRNTATNISSFCPRVKEPSGTVNVTPEPLITKRQPDEVAMVDTQQSGSKPVGIVLFMLYMEFFDVAAAKKIKLLIKLKSGRKRRETEKLSNHSQEHVKLLRLWIESEWGVFSLDGSCWGVAVAGQLLLATLPDWLEVDGDVGPPKSIRQKSFITSFLNNGKGEDNEKQLILMYLAECLSAERRNDVRNTNDLIRIYPCRDIRNRDERWFPPPSESNRVAEEGKDFSSLDPWNTRVGNLKRKRARCWTGLACQGVAKASSRMSHKCNRGRRTPSFARPPRRKLKELIKDVLIRDADVGNKMSDKLCRGSSGMKIMEKSYERDRLRIMKFSVWFRVTEVFAKAPEEVHVSELCFQKTVLCPR